MSSVAIPEVQAAVTGPPLALLLSAEALAEQLGFSTRTIWRLRSAGKLPQPVKIGGSARWRADEISTWIRAGCPDVQTWGTDRLRTTLPKWRSRSTAE